MDDINSTILLVGGSLIGVVVLHGLWVAWRSRKEPLRFDLAEISDEGDDQDELALLRGELPNGGARVVGADEGIPTRRQAPTVTTPNSRIDESDAARPADGDGEVAWEGGEAPTEDAGDDVDEDSRAAALDASLVEDEVHEPEGDRVLTTGVSLADVEDTVGDEPMPTVEGGGRVEPVLGRVDGVATDQDGEAEVPTLVSERLSEVDDEEERPTLGDRLSREVEAAPPIDGVAAPVGEPPKQTTLDIENTVSQEISLTAKPNRRFSRFNFGPTRKAEHVDKPEPGKNPRAESEFIAMWVTARHGGNLRGADLIETLSRNEMRYTSAKVFCRQDPTDGSEQFQFVNGMEPGTFDITSMDTLETPRVLFLLTLPGPKNAIAALEDMVEVARDVAMTLGADLLDDRRSAISAQTIEHYRNRISDFTRKSLSRRSETR